MNNNYTEDKDAHDARIDNQDETILEGYKTKLKWYEKNYGPYIEKRGLKNWKNLFRKPTMRDLLLLIILAGVLLSAWAYKSDIQTCQETLKNFPNDVCEACSQSLQMKDEYEDIFSDDFDYSSLEITNVTT